MAKEFHVHPAAQEFNLPQALEHLDNGLRVKKKGEDWNESYLEKTDGRYWKVTGGHRRDYFNFEKESPEEKVWFLIS
jgi:hypothetical protein